MLQCKSICSCSVCLNCNNGFLLLFLPNEDESNMHEDIFSRMVTFARWHFCIKVRFFIEVNFAETKNKSTDQGLEVTTIVEIVKLNCYKKVINKTK